MVLDLISLFKNIFSKRPGTLVEWQEKSFFLTVFAICIAALPALVNSSIKAVDEGGWVSLAAYNASYLLCLVITFFNKIPFKLRAWTGVFIIFGLGTLNVFVVGPTGSGRIWLFTAAIYTTLVLGNKPGLLVLSAQFVVLVIFQILLNQDFLKWSNFDQYTPQLWTTTSITMMFLSAVSIVAMGSLIRGLSFSLEESREKSKQLEETTQRLIQRVDDHHDTIASLKAFEKRHTEDKTRLQQAQKMEAIGTLAGGIAHDFNNILFPILGYTEILLDEAKENSQPREGLEQIYSSAIRAKALVKQILTFSRQEDLEYHPLKIQIVLREVIKLLRSTLPRSIEIKESINQKCRPVNADSTQIHQIVMNLATNAYHAMGDVGGELRIYLDELDVLPEDSQHLGIKPRKVVCLAVADTGTGMSPDLVEKIFDPFFTTKETGKGTGMGLAVVHGIVKEMGGSINVYSEPGKGTEFKILLPVDDSCDRDKTEKSDQAIDLLKGTESILLVDDEEMILDLERRALEKLGYKVTIRTSPVKALEDFRRSPDEFDLVMTDMSMPGMSGARLAKELFNIRPDIPILLCTGYSENITPESALDMGIKGLVMKPLILKVLSIKIREILDAD